MSDSLQRSATAANQVLHAHAKRSECLLIELELAAWTIGRIGGHLQVLPNASENLHVQLAMLLGSGKFNEAVTFVDQYVDTEAGDKLLFSACDLAGDRISDELIELAYRHRGKWFSGPMLAKTTKPERLLGLFADQPTLGHAISTIGELVIVGRDQGKPITQAEQLWSEILRDQQMHRHDPAFLDTWLRIRVREGIEEAIDLLIRLASEFGRNSVFDGVTAVLARLVRVDAPRATTIVASSPDIWDRVEWFEPLKWWFEIPPTAEPLLEDLLSVNDRELDIRLARMLTSAQSLQWLERSLRSINTHESPKRARELSPGVSQLRSGGLEEDAERVRNQVLPFLSATAEIPDGVAALDLFDTLSAPGLPALVPWGAGPGLP
jgi:hypothetical protein